MDGLVLAKSDTSTGVASFFKGNHVLKCQDCKVKWETWEKGKRILK